MATSSAMHREVIKWIQTLELTCALTNPRRDLMNGYVVAEILSRYDRSVSLHSFDTGGALARRVDNWHQLEKYFKARQMKDLLGGQSNAIVRETLCGTPGAAQQLLEKLYTHLTKKQLKPNVVAEAMLKKKAEEIPPFMRPTAAELVRLQNNNTAQRLSMLTGHIDERYFIEKNATVVQKQREQQFQDRLEHHDRYEHPKLPMKTLIALAKGQRDGTYLGGAGAVSFDTGPGGAALPGSAAAIHLTSSRARQRITTAKQLDLRTHNPDLVSAFQQRQQHERDEQFRSHFDPDEDISRALSRVVAKPLQQSGHFSLALELAGMPRDEAEALPAVDCAASSPKFPRFDIVSVIAAAGDPSSPGSCFPAVVIDACFEQLHSSIVKHNAAKLLQQRPDDVVHLVLLLDLALNAAAQSAAGNFENFVRVCHMLEEIGAHLLRLDPSGRTFGIRDEIIAGICPRLAEVAPGAAMTALCRMLVAFTNVRDAEAIKRVLELTVKSTTASNLISAPATAAATAATPTSSTRTAPAAADDASISSGSKNLAQQRAESMFPATFFNCMSAADLKVLGTESLAAFYASSLIHRGDPQEAACGWSIFRCLAPASATAAATAVHFAAQLAHDMQSLMKQKQQDEQQHLVADRSDNSDGSGGRMTVAFKSLCRNAASGERWEMLLTALCTILTAVISHHGVWNDDDSEHNQQHAGEDQLSGTELLDLIEVTAVQLFEAVIAVQDGDRQQQQIEDAELRRRACFCAMAPLLRSDLVPSVSVAFVQHFLELSASERDALLSSASPSSGPHNNNHNHHHAAAAAKLSLPAVASCTGKEDLYVAGGLASLWPVEELLLILKVLQPSLSSLQVIEMLAALLVDENIAAHQPSWEEAVRFARADLVNATRNPVELRDVSDALLPRCQAAAANVIATLFPVLNPDEAAVAASSAQNANSIHHHNNHNDEDDSEDDYDDNGDHRHSHNALDDLAVNADDLYDLPNVNGAASKRMPAGAIDWLQSI